MKELLVGGGGGSGIVSLTGRMAREEIEQLQGGINSQRELPVGDIAKIRPSIKIFDSSNPGE
jgi:hypothetical protein